MIPHNKLRPSQGGKMWSRPVAGLTTGEPQSAAVRKEMGLSPRVLDGKQAYYEAPIGTQVMVVEGDASAFYEKQDDHSWLRMGQRGVRPWDGEPGETYFGLECPRVILRLGKD